MKNMKRDTLTKEQHRDIIREVDKRFAAAIPILIILLAISAFMLGVVVAR